MRWRKADMHPLPRQRKVTPQLLPRGTGQAVPLERVGAMRRHFSRKERRHLFILARGLCCHCGRQLNRNFHADHAEPFARGGWTILPNGQALCPDCNLAKGSSPNDRYFPNAPLASRSP